MVEKPTLPLLCFGQVRDGVPSNEPVSDISDIDQLILELSIDLCLLLHAPATVPNSRAVGVEIGHVQPELAKIQLARPRDLPPSP